MAMGKRYNSVKDMIEDMYSYKGKSKKWRRRREKKHLKLLNVFR